MSYCTDQYSVVKLPPTPTDNASRAVIEFDSAHNAVRFVTHTHFGSAPGAPPHQKLRAVLIEPDRPPVSSALAERSPLTLDRIPMPLAHDGSIRLGATNAYSGCTVRLTGLPGSLPFRMILDRLAQEEYNVVNAPTFITDERSTDDLVIVRAEKQYVQLEQLLANLADDWYSPPSPYSTSTATRSPYVQYLVRLKTVAEAHRLSRQWHSTWPTWGKDNS